MNNLFRLCRPVRQFLPTPVPRNLIEEIIQAGMLYLNLEGLQSPQFTVAAGAEKDGVLAAIRNGLNREKIQPLLPLSASNHVTEQMALDVMEQAPSLIFISDLMGKDFHQPMNLETRAFHLRDMQIMGGIAENMCLQAADLGLGTYWSISVVQSAYQELKQWLGFAAGEPAAVLALGYAAQDPVPPMSLPNHVIWRG